MNLDRRQILVGAGCCALHGPLAGATSLQRGRRRPFTVRDGIESARFLSDGPSPVELSADGRYYAFATVRGDVDRNVNIITVFCGRLGRGLSGAYPDRIAEFRTISKGDLVSLTIPGGNPAGNKLLWFPDSARLALLGEGENGKRQIVAVDVEARTAETLTRHPTNVSSFTLGHRGTFLFSAERERDVATPMPGNSQGFAIESTDAFAFLNGGHSSLDQWDTERFLVSGLGAAERRIVTNANGYDRAPAYISEKVSPDGRLAVIDCSPDRIPEAWDRYTNPYLRSQITDFRSSSPNGFFARMIKQLVLVDMVSGRSRPLWDAPVLRAMIAWSPDGQSVLVGPTYLPVAIADAAGLNEAAVAEVDVTTGRASIIPVDEAFGSRVNQLQWIDGDTVVVTSDGKSLAFSRSGLGWQRNAHRRLSTSASGHNALRLTMRQSRTAAPSLLASHGARSAIVFEMNPGLSELTLGNVTSFRWSDDRGRQWAGTLYLPTEYRAGQRYPVVLQLNGAAAPDRFSLYGGGGLGSGPEYSTDAAQALANRQIATLAIEEKRGTEIAADENEAANYLAGYQAAVRALLASGIADGQRIGIAGFSRFGWYAAFAITHSPLFAAAHISDNMDASYVQAVLNGSTVTYDAENGAAPFGPGLQKWIERAPGFNADKVNCPVRLEARSNGLPGALNAWEMFSRLRQLRRPVELFVIPDIANGSHMLQNPAQIRASQEGVVDWFDFWLNGHEDADRKKRVQYERWGALRQLAHPTSSLSPP